MILVNGKSARKNSTWAKFPIYHAEADVENHFVSPQGKIYSDKIAKFVYPPFLLRQFEFTIKPNYSCSGVILGHSQ